MQNAEGVIHAKYPYQGTALRNRFIIFFRE